MPPCGVPEVAAGIVIRCRYINHRRNVPLDIPENLSTERGRVPAPVPAHRAAGRAPRKEAAMSEAPRSPTAVRRELGQRLRAMRTGADMTVAEAAERVGISTSKLTKIEL